MGVLLIIYTISFILCVIYTMFLIYTTKNEDCLEFYKSTGFGIDKLNRFISFLSISSVIPVFNTMIVVFGLYAFVKELFNE